MIKQSQSLPQRALRTLSLGSPVKAKKKEEAPAGTDGPLPSNSAELEDFVTRALIQFDPAPLLKVVEQALSDQESESKRLDQASGPKRQVLYKREGATPTWSVSEHVGPESEHKKLRARWAVLYSARDMAEQFLKPLHASWAVQASARALIGKCNAVDARKYGLTPTEMLRQDLLVLHMAYVTFHHEAAGKKPKPGAAPSNPPDDTVKRAQSDMARRSWRSSWHQKLKLPLASIGRPTGDTEPTSPEPRETVVGTGASEPVNVSRRTTQRERERERGREQERGRGREGRYESGSGRSSPTKPRITVRFKSMEELEQKGPEKEELRPVPGSLSPPYAKRHESGGRPRGSREWPPAPTVPEASGGGQGGDASVSAPNDSVSQGREPGAGGGEH